MKLSTALMQLRSMPVGFLRNNLLSIAGHAQSGVHLYRFGYYGNPAAGVNEGFKFAPGFVAPVAAGLDGMSVTTTQVHNVRMVPKSENVDISAIEPYVLDGTGPDLMVTGQLSACVFVATQIPGGLAVAHIQPGGNLLGGAGLRQSIRLMGRFQGYGRVSHIFGLGTEYTSRAHVVGVRSGGAWHVYAQQIASGAGPVTGAVQIV